TAKLNGPWSLMNTGTVERRTRSVVWSARNSPTGASWARTGRGRPCEVSVASTAAPSMRRLKPSAVITLLRTHAGTETGVRRPGEGILSEASYKDILIRSLPGGGRRAIGGADPFDPNSPRGLHDRLHRPRHLPGRLRRQGD